MASSKTLYIILFAPGPGSASQTLISEQSKYHHNGQPSHKSNVLRQSFLAIEMCRGGEFV